MTEALDHLCIEMRMSGHDSYEQRMYVDHESLRFVRGRDLPVSTRLRAMAALRRLDVLVTDVSREQ